MSSIYVPSMPDADYERQLDRIARDPRMAPDNIQLAPTTGLWLRKLLLGLGVAGLSLTIIGAFVLGERGPTHALASYHAAVMATMAMCVGALFVVMILNMLSAGWTAGIRRQFENVMSLIWLPMIGVAITLMLDTVMGGRLFDWMASDTYLAELKYPFLNVPFFWFRVVIYAAILLYLAKRFHDLSHEQDRTGNRWLTNKARKTAAWGLPVGALTIAFAGFDWLMSVDYHFFSTMWGVYFFAGAVGSAIGLVTLILAIVRGMGRLTGVVTAEHDEDMGKLLFSFTVFWAYIAFSQYFLIWYSNIPEETAFMNLRKSWGWEWTFYLLVYGHFVVPFLFLLLRPVKRSVPLMALGAAFLLVMHVFDMIWIIRPEVYAYDAQSEFTKAIAAGDPESIALG
ncbi:MAG: hypothetical protein AAF747_03135, partial [Planctomycetota bacterium]